MALQRGEGWLTCATNEDEVISALVLAESLKRSGTTRRIGVITSGKLSKESGTALRKVFHASFLMEECFVPSLVEEDQAKIFAFSLRLFDKCIFLSPNSLVLENVDILFEDSKDFKLLKNNSNDGSIDLSCFLFTPCWELCEYLSSSSMLNGKFLSGKYLKTWITKQYGSSKMGYIPGNSVLKFSVQKGCLLKQRTHSNIIQFVDKKSDDSAGQITSLQSRNLGLPEKLICEKWLEIFHKSVVGPLQGPKCAIPPSSGMKREVYKNEPIAIIGMSCRYPGANNIEEFWNMLFDGKEAIREPPVFRWTKEHSLRVSQQQRQTNAGFLSTSVDEFDARFFGVSPKETAFMDPQARLLHEVVWEALEDSGIDPLALQGSHTGIFTGSWMNDYKDIVQGSTEQDFFRTYMGNSMGATAARLSFLLGLTGPSIATESGCSSAIVALDLAVKSLRNGESTLALTGGVNLLLHPFTSSIMDYVIAPNGRCKTFDSKADGFGRAEGCGVLVLKRMSDALRDRDDIWALIRGSAVSQEGLSRSLGTPTVHCEALAMQLALENANVKPEMVSFVETHGTGTSVGDPMEVSAIAKAYYSPDRRHPLVIGSVKTNVGHTESCSGITGIMKTVLAMQHELIPKHRNLDTLNPEIKLDSIPAIIPLEPITWPKVPGQPRIAGVSSFGITGTDGHVIIQEAPDYEFPKFTLGLERTLHIMKISAKTSEALEHMLKNYEDAFSNQVNADKNNKLEKSLSWADAAHTANVGRASFNYRTFVVASDFDEAIKSIQSRQESRGDVTSCETGKKICFLFTGQGSQYAGMAKLLYETNSIFHIHFDECERHLKEIYNVSIRQVLWEYDPSSKDLSRTIYSQTSIFCVEYCLLKLWQSWGIQPDYVLGHSLGEFAAAVAADILSFEDALKLVAERSRLIDNLPRGSMLVIKANKEEVEKCMKAANANLDFAALNSPDQTVVAGNSVDIQHLLEFCKGQGIKSTILEATHAFHSHHMDPMLEEYRKIAETITYKKGNNGVCRYVSGMEGRIINELSEINAEYWVRHTREKVSFVNACKALRQESCQDFIEVGPQPVLSSFVMMNNEDVQLNCLPSLRRGTNDWQTILTTLGKLYLLGHKVDWKGFDETYKRNKVSLPFHPFHRKSFWVEPNETSAALIHPLVGYPIANASNLSIFQNDLSIKSAPYVKDHCIGSKIIFPGAGYTEMALSAGYCVANGLTDSLEKPRRAIRVENVRFDAPLELKDEKNCRLQVIVDLPETAAEDQQTFRVKVYHQNKSEQVSGKWVLHASANFAPTPAISESLKKWNPKRIAEIIDSIEPCSSDIFYKRVDEGGLKFGETFQSITRYWNTRIGNEKKDEVVTEMKIPENFNKYLLHPLVIDAMIQTKTLSLVRYVDFKLQVPVKIGQLTLFSMIEDEKMVLNDKIYLHANWEGENVNIFLVTHDYEPIALMEDVELVDTTVKTIESILEQQNSSIPDSYVETWKIIPGPNTDLVAELPDLGKLLSGSEFIERMKAIPEVGPEEQENIYKTDRLIYLYALNAFYNLGWNPKPNQLITVSDFCINHGILPNFTHLVHFYFKIFHEEDGIMNFNDITKFWKINHLPPAQDEVKNEMKKLSKIGALTAISSIHKHFSNKLSHILTGVESALTILFPTEENMLQYSADSFYQNYPAREEIMMKVTITLEAIFEKARLLNKTGVLRILEVGCGTGSMSLSALRTTKKVWGDKFEYYFTDVSPSFFIKADKKLEEFKSNIKFAVFDIEASPVQQGIPLNYFDIVLCTDVIHATRSLQETMINLRQTLKNENGMLLFTETLGPSRDITFVFGLLDGYWRMEDFEWRRDHCCAEEYVWQHVLPSCGFQSVHITKGYWNRMGCITAQASQEFRVGHLNVPERISDHDKKEWIIFTTGNNAVHKIANVLVSCENNVTAVFRATDNQTESSELDKRICVVKLRSEVEETTEIFYDILNRGNIEGIIYAWGMDTKETEQKRIALPYLHIAKNILTKKVPPKLYILTQGVHSISESVVSNPSAATLFGMTKALKNENSDLFVRYVDLEHGSETDAMVDNILWELVMSKGNKEVSRVQVAYRENLRHEPRLTKANVLTNSDQLELPQGTDRCQLALPKSRMINDLGFIPLERENVTKNEVEIRISCYSINFKDILTILKPSEEFEKLNSVGLDFAGVVSKVGSGVAKDKFKVGDRVFGANFKEVQLPSHLVLDSSALLKIPDSMTFCEAATLPAVCATSIYCLNTVARMKKGDTVLIHTGSGGVGLSSIQVAKQIGANIITTAGNPRKRAYLKSLGIEHVFNSRNPSFGDEIMKVTNGRGVDIVLNSITGPGMKEASLGACARNARFVEMSKLSIWTPDEVKALRSDVEYTIVDLTVLEHEQWVNLLETLQGHLVQGIIKPLPYVKFDALFIRQALQFFQKAKHIGKVVCTMPQVIIQDGHFNAQVPLFNSESSYLITGGLGGIGFEVCKWMLEKGATDILLIGRSPPKPDIAAIIEDLRNKKGCNIIVRQGDVSDIDQCKTIIDEVCETGKPLRGVMHCAGVLRDNMYANQTWKSFSDTFDPKVNGTWNLHNLTIHLTLEHFVLYSSITALMGTPSQPNHAAANCFEDQFAHYRHSLGLPSTSINWGQWAQVGCAKEITLPGVLPISVKRMLNGLEATLRTHEIQPGFCEFESMTMWSMICPLITSYFDDKILNKMKDKPSNYDDLKTDSIWQEMDNAADKMEKIIVTSVYLKRILRASLRLEADEPINDDANMQDLGVDSLMLIELKNSIQSLFGSRLSVTANLLKNSNTVRELATALVSKLLNEDDDVENVPVLSPEELTTLLTNDCQLCDNFQVPQSGGPVKVSEMKTVLVTGATGQLGPYVLAEICKSYKSIDKIVCIIRTNEQTSPKEKLEKVLKSMGLLNMINLSKIHYVRGKVQFPNFGMNEGNYQDLCHSVDGIIHCAVKSSHIEPYRKYDSDTGTDIRSVNVCGTANIIKFAATTRAKHVYYASAYTSIFGGNDKGTLCDDWPELDQIKIIVDNNIPGYQTSKYVCEMLLKEANVRGIPCKVFRFPWITGDSQTGQLNYINNHYILRLLSYLKLQAMPSLVMPANVMPVDTCAELSLRLFFMDEAPLEIYNIGHPNPQVEQEFIHVGKKFGSCVEIVEFQEFANKLQSDSPLESLKELYTDVERVMGLYTSEAFVAIQGYLISPETYFSNTKVRNYIPDFGDSIESSMDIIQKNLVHVKSQGFFDKFNI